MEATILPESIQSTALVVGADSPSLTIPCYLINNLTEGTEEQCKFVIDNNCLDEEGIIDYVYLVYCRLGAEHRYTSMGIIVSLVIILFLNLSAVADKFLCPSLLTVAKNLRMSDSLAGITLLAFGNGCPDIFSSLAAATSDRPKLIVGELLGAGIFCTSIVAGLVFISTEFKPDRRPLLRDGTFYSLSVALVWYFCWKRELTFFGALTFIIIYSTYLMIALCDQFFQAKVTKRYPISEGNNEKNASHLNKEEQIIDANYFIWRRGSQGIVAEVHKQQLQQRLNSINLQPEKDRVSLEISVIEKSGHKTDTPNPVCSCSLNEKKQVVAKVTVSDIKPESGDSKSRNQLMDQQINILHNHSAAASSNEPLRRNNSLSRAEWNHFRSNLNPIDTENWSDSRFSGKVIEILRAPILFITILTVPVVDMDRVNNNWCRLLNCMHCFLIPTAWIMITTLRDTCGDAETHETVESCSDHIWPAIRLGLLIAGVLLSIFLFYSTEPFKAPRYHAAFAYLGFVMSVTWIYLLATEIISLLKTVGLMFSMTDTALGLGVLAWGNSLGDIVANLSLAEAGYPRMALGASIGAPLLNLLLGFGLSFTISLKPGQKSTLEYTPTIVLLCSTLITILVSIMLSTLIPSNRSRRPFGFLLISGYVIYFLLAVCLECGILFNQGTN